MTRETRDPVAIAGWIAAGAGVAIAGLGSAVMAGWATGNLLLIHGLPGRPPMPPASAVGFVLSGSALLAATLRWTRVALVIGLLVAAGGVASLLEWQFGIEFEIEPALVRNLFPQMPFPDRMPPNAALCFALAGAGIAVLSGFRRRGQGGLAGALSGSVVLALGAMALAGYLFGLPTYDWWRIMTRMAVHAAAGFAALGAGLVVLAWRCEQAKVAGLPRWSPLPVGLAALTGTLCFWQATEAVGDAVLAWVPEGAAAGVPAVIHLLSEVTLITGLILTGMLVVAVHLVGTNRRRGEALAEANRAALAELGARLQVEQELDLFFAMSPDLLSIAGMDGYFKRINPAFGRTLGYSNEELLAHPLLDLVHPEDRERAAAEQESLAGGGPAVLFENRCRTKDGSYRWLRWNTVPDVDRRLVYAVARDVTEIKRNEEALREARDELEIRVRERTAELESFTYSVSHDLRAPLRHIDGYSKLLLEEAGARLDGDSRRWLERIREGAQQMASMVDDLLALSRMGRREPDRQPTEQRALVEAAMHDLRPEMADREVDLRVGKLPPADCDPALVRQVWVNLLSNALKFTRPRPRAVIEVGCAPEDQRNVFYIRDNGVGFDMKYADKLFGVFQRLHRREDFDGTGVGLATVQRIIHKHGGRVWAEAEPGRGAAFFFTLGEADSRVQEVKAAMAAGR